jgi:hypothetical protein
LATVVVVSIYEVPDQLKAEPKLGGVAASKSLSVC